MDTANRTAIVTGSSKGIGAAVARRLAGDGFNVVVNYAHGEAEAQAVVDEISTAGGKAVAVKADISNSVAMATLFEQASTRFGSVDVLVNNAGIMKLAPLAQVEDDAFDQQIAINLKGLFNGMRLAARQLNDGGSIVSFSSSVVGLYPPTYAVYAATKAAAEAMTHILAKELGTRGITVNAIAPGPVATDLFLGDKTDEQVEQTKKTNPLGRLGEPDDIARAVSFLVGPDGRWINGQVLRANGGVI